MYTGSETKLKTLLTLCRLDLCDGRLGLDHVSSVLPVSDAEWRGVLECALNHGLAGLLYRAVANANFISPAALQPIRTAALAQTSRSCRLSAELLEILATFRNLDIEALVLKGPAVAVRFYRHISLREFCDLDILVHPADVDRASLVLEQRGYRTTPRTAAIDELSRKGQHHFIFFRDEDNAEVELHWALNSYLERAPLEGTGLWSRIHSVLLWDQPLPSLGIEDTLLFLCVHGFKHRWSRLNWLTDIAYILRSKEQIDWDALVLRSREIGCHRMLLVSLGLASSLLGSVVPPEIEKLADADPMTFNLVEQIRAALLNDTPIDNVGAIMYHLRARERFRDHFVTAFRLLRRIWRLTAADGLSGNRRASTKLAAAFRRPVRLYKTFGLAWVKSVFRFRRFGSRSESCRGALHS